MKKFRSVKIITYCVGALLIAALLISLCVKSNVEYEVCLFRLLKKSSVRMLLSE